MPVKGLKTPSKPLAANKSKRQVRQYSEEDKQQFYDDWKRSGLSRSKYCQQKGLSTSTFLGWSKQPEGASLAKKFVAVKTTTKQPPAFSEFNEVMELCLVSGIRLRLKRPGQLGELAALIKSLNQE